MNQKTSSNATWSTESSLRHSYDDGWHSSFSGLFNTPVTHTSPSIYPAARSIRSRCRRSTRSHVSWFFYTFSTTGTGFCTVDGPLVASPYFHLFFRRRSSFFWWTVNTISSRPSRHHPSLLCFYATWCPDYRSRIRSCLPWRTVHAGSSGPKTYMNNIVLGYVLSVRSFRRYPSFCRTWTRTVRPSYRIIFTRFRDGLTMCRWGCIRSFFFDITVLSLNRTSSTRFRDFLSIHFLRSCYYFSPSRTPRGVFRCQRCFSRSASSSWSRRSSTQVCKCRSNTTTLSHAFIFAVQTTSPAIGRIYMPKVFSPPWSRARWHFCPRPTSLSTPRTYWTASEPSSTDSKTRYRYRHPDPSLDPLSGLVSVPGPQEWGCSSSTPRDYGFRMREERLSE